jgi:hypothetical protein
MKDNKPCRDAQGRYYWPKIYFTEENEAKRVNSIGQEAEAISRTEYLSGFKESSNHSTKTAAPSPQKQGFQ